MFSTETGYGDVDWFSQLGGYAAMPIPADVSNGSPAEQPYTATGNGSGQFVTQDWQGALFGGLQTALNYALLRDQQKMTAVAQAPVQAAQLQTQVQQVQHGNMLTYVLIGAAVLAVVLVTRE